VIKCAHSGGASKSHGGEARPESVYRKTPRARDPICKRDSEGRGVGGGVGGGGVPKKKKIGCVGWGGGEGGGGGVVGWGGGGWFPNTPPKTPHKNTWLGWAPQRVGGVLLYLLFGFVLCGGPLVGGGGLPHPLAAKFFAEYFDCYSEGAPSRSLFLKSSTFAYARKNRESAYDCITVLLQKKGRAPTHRRVSSVHRRRKPRGRGGGQHALFLPKNVRTASTRTFREKRRGPLLILGPRTSTTEVLSTSSPRDIPDKRIKEKSHSRTFGDQRRRKRLRKFLPPHANEQRKHSVT